MTRREVVTTVLLSIYKERNLLRRVFLFQRSIQLSVFDRHSTLNKEEAFSRKSEADASEFLENLDEMFPWYYLYSNNKYLYSGKHILVSYPLRKG